MNCTARDVLVVNARGNKVTGRCVPKNRQGGPDFARRRSLAAAGYTKIKNLSAAQRRDALQLAVAQNSKAMVIVWLKRLQVFFKNRPDFHRLVSADLRYVQRLPEADGLLPAPPRPSAAARPSAAVRAPAQAARRGAEIVVLNNRPSRPRVRSPPQAVATRTRSKDRQRR